MVKLMSQIKLAAINVVLLTSLTSCGGGSDSSEPSNQPPVVVAPPPAPPVTLTPERDGHSVARMWNEVLLFAIRNDFARPTVHARNLFHISAAMYDAWAEFDDTAKSYLYGNQVGEFSCAASAFDAPDDILPEQEEALSFAAYRLIRHRFRFSPGVGFIYAESDSLMETLGFDTQNDSVDISGGSAAALGNAIAECYIE
jgi:hypothetical protein